MSACGGSPSPAHHHESGLHTPIRELLSQAAAGYSVTGDTKVTVRSSVRSHRCGLPLQAGSSCSSDARLATGRHHPDVGLLANIDGGDDGNYGAAARLRDELGSRAGHRTPAARLVRLRAAGRPVQPVRSGGHRVRRAEGFQIVFERVLLQHEEALATTAEVLRGINETRRTLTPTMVAEFDQDIAVFARP